MPFPQQVNVQPAVAVAGDFASYNPRAGYNAGPGGLVAGLGGLTVGRFAWVYPPLDPNSAPTVASNNGSGPPAGFVHREQRGLITGFLQEASMVIPQGLAVDLMTAGDFFVRNDGTTPAQVGQFAYANYADGRVSFGAAGAGPTASGSASTIAAGTFSVTGSVANNILTVTAVTSGTVYAGSTISGTGIATGTKVVSQIDGTPGGIGHYYVSIPEQTNTGSITVSGTYGLLTIGGTVTGNFVVGGVLTGTSVVSGSRITQMITSTGGAGTAVVDPTGTTSSTAITQALAAQSKWFATSAGLVGELVKMSSWPLG